MREILTWQFGRFILVGIVNAGFGYGCFALFLYIGLHYSLALVLATILGVAFNFKSAGVLVFRSRDNRKALRFIVDYVGGYSLSTAGIKLFSLAGIDPSISGAALIPPMAVLTYVLQRRYVFALERSTGTTSERVCQNS
jgi:putative flippase GtrA